MANEISVQCAKALELHNRIMVSAQLVQTNLWDMCTGLKEMRDGKLYKELGYQNFEEYCEKEHGFSRSNAHKYISIVENIDPENVSTWKHFGKGKLYLLSTLSESEQEKITAENDVQSVTVRELEQQIKELKSDNEILNRSNDNLHDRLEDAAADRKKIIDQKVQLAKKITELENEITELESRPIEVAVAEPSEDVRQLKEEIDYLKKSNEQQQEYLKKASEKNQAEAARLLSEQKERYEEKLRQASSVTPRPDDKQVFKAYYTTAYDSFKRMIDFAKNSSNDKDFFHEKIGNLISFFLQLSEKL